MGLTICQTLPEPSLEPVSDDPAVHGSLANKPAAVVDEQVSVESAPAVPLPKFHVMLSTLAGREARLEGLSAAQPFNTLLSAAEAALGAPPGGLQLCLGDRALGQGEERLPLGELGIGAGTALSAVVRPSSAVYEQLGSPEMCMEMGTHSLRRKRLLLSPGSSCVLVEQEEVYVIKAFVERRLIVRYGQYSLEDDRASCRWSTQFGRSEYTRIGDTLPAERQFWSAEALAADIEDIVMHGAGWRRLTGSSLASREHGAAPCPCLDVPLRMACRLQAPGTDDIADADGI